MEKWSVTGVFAANMKTLLFSGSPRLRDIWLILRESQSEARYSVSLGSPSLREGMPKSGEGSL